LTSGAQSSVVVTGPGGLGKSFTVTQALTAVVSRMLYVLDDFAVGSILKTAKTLRVIKGYSTLKVCIVHYTKTRMASLCLMIVIPC
jgi:predicted ATP-dependent serine protease